MVQQMQQQFSERTKESYHYDMENRLSSQSGHAKNSKKQLLLDSYYKMMHGLYKEPGKDIIIGDFHNSADIKIELCQKKKNDNPKTNK